jgi:hypothetical protein
MPFESKINVPVCHFVIDKHVNSWNKLFIRQAEIKWSFFVEHLNSWFAGTHERD